MNSVQYVSMVTNDGEKAKRLKCRVKTNHYLYLKENCSWEELKELVLRGCTIGRVGTSSEFIAIDIDDSEITHEAMTRWAAGYNSAHGDCVLATPSRSGIWYKHHVYFKVPEYQVADHFKVFTECFHKITEHFGGSRVRYDPGAARYYQCMFQTGDPGQFVLPGSVQLAWWCKKDDAGPVLYVATVGLSGCDDDEWHLDDDDDGVDAPTYPVDGCFILPNNAEFYFNLARLAGLPPKELPELPFELAQASYVRKGERHFAMMKLVDVFTRNAALIQFFEMGCAEDDVRHTLERHIRQHFEDGGQFLREDAASIDNAIARTWSKYADAFAETTRSYEDLKIVLGKGSHRYSIKTFATEYMERHPEATDIDEACIVIVDAYNGNPEDYDTAEFHAMLSEVREAIKPLFVKRKSFRIEKDLDEARRVYELTKNIQLFDDQPPLPPMSFEEFCANSTAGDRYVVEERLVRVDRKEHKTHKPHKPHSNKGRCGDYKVVDGVLAVPKDKITPYIRSYCSRNSIKLVSITNK